VDLKVGVPKPSIEVGGLSYLAHMNKIILASQSPRRKQLLEWAEIPFEIVVPDTDESYPAAMPVSEVPMHIAMQKACAAKALLAAHQQQMPILAADTVV